MMSEHDHLHHRSLALELLNRARRSGMAGATLLRAQQGEGRSRQLRRQHLWRDDATVALVIVDAPERIDRFLEELGDIADGLVTTVGDLEWREA